MGLVYTLCPPAPNVERDGREAAPSPGSVPLQDDDELTQSSQLLKVEAMKADEHEEYLRLQSDLAGQSSGVSQGDQM